MRRIVKWTAVAVLVLAATLYVALLAGVWMMQDKIMFGRRTSEIIETPAARQWTYEDVWAEVDGQKTHGWWIPVANARGAVLFSHGNGRNVSGYLDDAALFRELGFSVLLYDYGGYGLSTGEPSEARACADARAMWDHLVNIKKIPPEKIVLDGSSMGGGVTVDLATQVSPGAVVLESTFTTIPDIVTDMHPYIPADMLFHIEFRNIDKISHIQKPILIIHSKQDTVVPFEHSQRLLERAMSPKEFVEIQGAHHKGKFASRQKYLDALGAFLKKHVPGAP